MSTHNICFRGEIRKICGYPLLSVAMALDKMFFFHYKSIDIYLYFSKET